MLTERLEFGRLLDLAERRAIFEFRLSADSFPRLRKILVDDHPGELDVQLEFQVVGEDLPQVALHVRGSLGLTCQRCLEELDWPLGLDVALALVADERDSGQLEDPFDSIEVPAEGLWLGQVIEDEILAAVPIAVLHAGQEQCEAVAATDGSDQPAARPFASLRELMQQRTGNGKPD